MGEIEDKNERRNYLAVPFIKHSLPIFLPIKKLKALYFYHISFHSILSHSNNVFNCLAKYWVTYD